MPLKKILVVDDEPTFLSLLKETLELRGFECDIVPNAVEGGLMLSGQRKPDMILMDVKMPGINGLEACEAIKKNINTGKIPIIVISAASDPDIVLQAKKIGVEDYFVKPVNIENLIGRIKEILKIS